MTTIRAADYMPHECRPYSRAPRNAADRDLWRCDDCGRWWVCLGIDIRWRPVGLLDLRARRAIRAAREAT